MPSIGAASFSIQKRNSSDNGITLSKMGNLHTKLVGVLLSSE